MSAETAYYFPIPVPDLVKLPFQNLSLGNAANLYYWTSHDANGGEFIIDAFNRIAIVPGVNGADASCIQLGSSDASYSPIVIQHNGDASALTTPMPGKKLLFISSRWDGAAAVYDYFSVRSSWDSTVQTLTFYDNDPGTSSAANNQAVGTALMQLREGEGLQMSANRSISFVAGTGRATTQTNLGFVSKVKTADTSRASTTVTTDDPTLVQALDVGTYSYRVSLIFANASAVPGFTVNFAFSGTSGFSSGIGHTGRHGVNTVLSLSYPNGSDGTIFAPTIAQSGYADGYLELTGTVNVTVAGNFAVKWAQGISDLANTTLKTGSSIVFQKLSDT